MTNPTLQERLRALAESLRPYCDPEDAEACESSADALDAAEQMAVEIRRYKQGVGRIADMDTALAAWNTARRQDDGK